MWFIGCRLQTKIRRTFERQAGVDKKLSYNIKVLSIAAVGQDSHGPGLFEDKKSRVRIQFGASLHVRLF